MFLSVFDIFKIGIGPSSSHTMGPMSAASHFLELLRSGQAGAVTLADLRQLQVRLYGSLAFTGKGHATDRACLLGLLGFEPDTLDLDQAEQALTKLARDKQLRIEDATISFDPETDVIFDFGPSLEHHANGMTITAMGKGGQSFTETYYSIGGGFILTEAELLAEKAAPESDLHAEQEEAGYPYPFGSAAEMLRMGQASGQSIASMKRANEGTAMTEAELSARVDQVISVMKSCMDRGLKTSGILPGGLNVKRRAKAIHDRLVETRSSNTAQPHVVNDWLSVYAMAVNEENAAGGQVVTSPTNGAAGVVPAVLRYYEDHCIGATKEGEHTFLLTAAAIGGIIKHNASISGAECGCQAEVGSASAMAAAGLCAALGGTNEQAENAAEIALEHHLGMTCDPVKGLVQVPCIERNGMGAIKAVSAASLALYGDGTHFMPLDNCIETMRQTGLDMQDRYKETSLGGLAVNLPEC